MTTQPDPNAHKIYIAGIAAVAVVILAIILALFMDEVIDAPAEKACVTESQSQAKDDWRGCNL